MMVFAMEHATSAAQISKALFHSFMAVDPTSCDFEAYWVKLFAVSDILCNSSSSHVPAARAYRRELEGYLGQMFERLNYVYRNTRGKIPQKLLKNFSLRFLRAWKEHSVYEPKLIQGWEAVLKRDVLSYYSFHLHEPNFEPAKVKSKKVQQKIKMIVLPELRAYYKQLEQMKSHTVEHECKTNGIYVKASERKEDLLAKLVALEEFKIRKLVKVS
jgi:hypothetical protein